MSEGKNLSRSIPVTWRTREIVKATIEWVEFGKLHAFRDPKDLGGERGIHVQCCDVEGTVQRMVMGLLGQPQALRLKGSVPLGGSGQMPASRKGKILTRASRGDQSKQNYDLARSRFARNAAGGISIPAYRVRTDEPGIANQWMQSDLAHPLGAEV